MGRTCPESHRFQGERQILRLALGIIPKILGAGCVQDLQDAFRVGIDCIPAQRCRLILAIARDRDWKQLPIPLTVRNREIEELEALQLITPDKGLTGKTSTLLQTANIVFEGVKLTD